LPVCVPALPTIMSSQAERDAAMRAALGPAAAGTLLLAAVCEGRAADALRLLVEADTGMSIELDAADADGWTALMVAACRGGALAPLVPRLLALGAARDRVDAHHGCSALMLAAAHGERAEAAVRALLRAGARADLVENKRGRSALALACECGSEGAALELAAASGGGAELCRADALTGRLPLDNAIARGFARAAEAIRARGGRTGAELEAAAAAARAPEPPPATAAATVGAGTGRGVGAAALGAVVGGGGVSGGVSVGGGVGGVVGGCREPTKGDRASLSASVYSALRDGKVSLALELLGKGGVDVDFAFDPSRGHTLLMDASMREGGYSAVVARLIEAGAALDLVNKDGSSALMLACAFGNAASALLLVEAGASLNRVGGVQGRSALDWAAKNGLADVAAAIRARGGRTGDEVRKAVVR
jgi:ankyrin repeat protein